MKNRICCSNESNIDVFFDNLQVVHNHGPLLQEDAFYPFGVSMAGISSKAAGGIDNKYKFNSSSELNNDLDVGIYETPLRGYDAQIGRFEQGSDPLAAVYNSFSNYAFVGNNPVMFSDPTGAKIDSHTREQENKRNEQLLIKNEDEGGGGSGESGLSDDRWAQLAASSLDHSSSVNTLLSSWNGGVSMQTAINSSVNALMSILGFGLAFHVQQNANRRALQFAGMSKYVYGGDDADPSLLIDGWKVSKKQVPGIVNKSDDDGFLGQLFERVIDGKTVEYCYAFAGTQDLNIDGLQNLLQLQGLSSQYEKADNNAELLDKFTKKEGVALYFTGHSLGGGLAALASLETGRIAYTFNAASLSSPTILVYCPLGRIINCNKINAYADKMDPLTNSQDFIFMGSQGIRHTINSHLITSLLNHHSIDTMIFGLSY